MGWLNHPITKKWHKRLKEDKEELEANLVFKSRTSFCNGMTTARDQDEILLHHNLVAVDLNLKILEPLFEFLEYCDEKSLDALEIPERYLRQAIGESEGVEFENPLDFFIKNQ